MKFDKLYKNIVENIDSSDYDTAENRKEAKIIIQKNYKDFIDDVNELNYTGLAELIADQLGIEDETIPEWIFDIAIDEGDKIYTKEK